MWKLNWIFLYIFFVWFLGSKISYISQRVGSSPGQMFDKMRQWSTSYDSTEVTTWEHSSLHFIGYILWFIGVIVGVDEIDNLAVISVEHNVNFWSNVFTSFMMWVKSRGSNIFKDKSGDIKKSFSVWTGKNDYKLHIIAIRM